MDSQDKAAALADPDSADAINRDRLLTSASLSRSGRSSWAQVSQSASNSCRYGATSSKLNRYLTDNELGNGDTVQSVGNESSWWLLRHYKKLRAPKYANNNKDCSININLYDNISFNDMPCSLIRPLSRNASTEPEQVINADPGQAPPGNWEPSRGACCFGRFRIFLACYLLLGVTLAIYSRNAMSLAAVKMVANNEINNEMYILFSSPMSSHKNDSTWSIIDEPFSPDDHSCPIEHSHRTNDSPSSASEPETNHKMKLASYLPVSVNPKQATRSQLTEALRVSIRDRIKNNDLVDWTPTEQGLVFGAGSVGNLLMAIPLTRLGEIYGAKWVIFVAVLGAALQSGLMPIVSTFHVSLVVIFQVIFNGLTFGADCVAYTLFANWLTPTEMSFFVACLMICYQLGIILSSFITARLIVMNINWSWCFYTPAILCAIWTLFWALIAASEPSKSWLISRKELNFLQRQSKISQMIYQVETVDATRQKGAPANSHLPIDWFKLAKDPNIWALISVKFSLRWFFSVYASLMPTYLSSVLHMSVDLIGKVSVFKSGIGLVLGLLISYLTKSIVHRRPFNLSLATFRKVFQSIVSFGLSLSLLVIMIVDCSQWVTIICLTLNGICINFYVAAALQVPIDLSSSHCGLITSITTTLALGQAIGAPISGFILNNGPADRSLWRIVWLVSILLNTFSGVMFIVLVDSKPKDYNKYPDPPGNNSTGCTIGKREEKRN